MSNFIDQIKAFEFFSTLSATSGLEKIYVLKCKFGYIKLNSLSKAETENLTILSCVVSDTLVVIGESSHYYSLNKSTIEYYFNFFKENRDINISVIQICRENINGTKYSDFISRFEEMEFSLATITIVPTNEEYF